MKCIYSFSRVKNDKDADGGDKLQFVMGGLVYKREVRLSGNRRRDDVAMCIKIRFIYCTPSLSVDVIHNITTAPLL